jgi:cytidylate kinase
VSRPRVVAIDGPAGSGKSTLARALSRTLGLPYVNTGLMYRALTAAAIRDGVPSTDQEGLLRLTGTLKFTMTGANPRELVVEGYPDELLMTSEVEQTVSAVAGHPRVRTWMRDAQRALGGRGAVMEGRDIGSVVFPDAVVKIFLDAPAENRTERRVVQRTGREREEVAEALEARDELDARTNPFAPAPGAWVIDTEARDAAATLRAVLDLIRERAPELLR